ncbi:MAG: hypothetical protein Q9207_007883 [Kuettlingeria erythrocarpa]
MSEATSTLAEAAGPPLTAHPSTPAQMLSEITRRWPENHAFVSMYQTRGRYETQPGTSKDDYLAWTYRQLDEKADALAASLVVRGIRSGMRLAVLLPNSAEWALLFWTSVKLGTTFVPLDERAVSRKDQMDHFLGVLKPSTLFVSEAAQARTLLENHPLAMDAITIKAITQPTSSRIDGWQNLEVYLAKGAISNGIDPTHRRSDLEAGVVTSEPPMATSINGGGGEGQWQTESDLDRPLYIIFTSGVSGLPKACPLSNRNVWALEMANDSLDPGHHTDVMLMNAAPSHSMGISSILHTWFKGAAVVVPSPAFDAKITIEAIERFECTHMSAIPTMVLALLRQPTFDPERTRSLRMVLLGGTIISPSIMAAATNPKLLGASEALATFGMSEGLPICSSSSKQDIKVDRGAVSLGKALPGTRVRVCQPGSRQVLKKGEIGELHFSGGMVVTGYLFGDNSCFYDDESGHWIASGDEAMMDEEGNIFIFGRYKDIIIRGGENLSPALIENCLGKAGVLGQIVGIPDDIAGEVPLAIVQGADQAQIPKTEVLDLVMETLGPACLPTAYITLAELGMASFPSTTSGKVRKSELRKAALEYLAAKPTKNASISVNGTGSHAVGSTETLVTGIVAELTGQTGDAFPPGQPLSTILDSINMLRLQAKIQQATAQKVSIEILLGGATIETLMKSINMTQAVHTLAPSLSRSGPPSAADMVHTHDDTRSESRTILQVEPLLTKHGLSWQDIESVFPIPDLSNRFEATRPMAFSIRMMFVIDSTSLPVLRGALEATLEKWSMFRSLAVRFDDTPLFIIPRACKATSQAAIFELPDVENIQQLRGLRFPKADDNNVHLRGGGPLARFAITPIKNTGSTGLMMLAHHSIYDAISLHAFMRDLEANISGGSISEPCTDYKLFADAFYQHRGSIPAQTSVAFHVNRLRGMGSLRERPWPAQRCVGWFIGDDTGYHIPQSLRSPTLLQERTPLDGASGNYTGTIGIRRTAHLPDLAHLRSAHNISAPIVFKLACALLNAHLSGSPEVSFSQTQAGRQWPFLSPSTAAYLPNPITIAGNTLAVIQNRIYVPASATVGSLLTSLEAEQVLLSKHAHAPAAAITAQLNPADTAAFHAGRRQLLNWNPVMAEVVGKQQEQQQQGNSGGSSAPKMGLLHVEGFTEVMLEWHCGVVAGGSTAVVTARWDGAQFGKTTVDTWADIFMAALTRVAATENWDRKLGEVVDLRKISDDPSLGGSGKGT